MFKPRRAQPTPLLVRALLARNRPPLVLRSGRGQRPRGWANQKVLYDCKRHIDTAQGLAVSAIHGDLLWCDGGWPGSCREHELIQLTGLAGVLDELVRSFACADGCTGYPYDQASRTPQSHA